MWVVLSVTGTFTCSDVSGFVSNWYPYLFWCEWFCQLKEWSTSSNWSFTNPSPISQIKTYFTYFTNMKRDWFFCRMTDRWYPSYSSLTDSSHYVMCILRIYNFVSFRKWQVSFTLFNLLVSVGNFEVKYRANILNLLEYVWLRKTWSTKPN